MSIAHDLDHFDPRAFGDPPIDPEDIPPDGEPDSNEPEMDGDLNTEQMMLLLDSIRWLWRDRNDFYASGNLSIYYKREQVEGGLGRPAFRGPDFFVVLGAEKRQRRSWTVWLEGGKLPNIIIEILSRSTASTDRGRKKRIYQDEFRTPEYFLFDPKKRKIEGYRLEKGVYVPVSAGSDGRMQSQELGLSLGVYQDKLRFFTPDGAVVKTAAEAEHERAERYAAGHERAELLATKLRELGIDPDKLG